MKSTLKLDARSLTAAVWLKGSANQLLTHAPLVLMALLALGSFVLFKQTAVNTPDAVQAVASQQDDYFLKRFVVTEFSPTGNAKLQLSGENAQHNPVSKALVVNQVRFNVSSNNSSYSGSAQSGIISDDGKLVALQGSAVVDKQAVGSGAKLHFESERITVRQNPDTVEASAPVRIQNGKTSMSAETLRYTDAAKETKLTGRVRMVIQ